MESHRGMQRMLLCKRDIAQVDALVNISTHKEIISVKINKNSAVTVALQAIGYCRCVFKLSTVNHA